LPISGGIFDIIFVIETSADRGKIKKRPLIVNLQYPDGSILPVRSIIITALPQQSERDFAADALPAIKANLAQALSGQSRFRCGDLH
jgi:hypothetical protein